MQELDEGFLDFLKRLWNSIVTRGADETDTEHEISKIDTDDESGYSGVEDLNSNDPQLKQKLARVFVRGLRLHQNAQQFGVHDEELFKILTSLWKGRITLNDFYKLKQTGVIDRIYSRVRERVRYQRKKRGVWHESKEK